MELNSIGAPILIIAGNGNSCQSAFSWYQNLEIDEKSKKMSVKA